MRTMSLYESGDSTGEVSLKDLFDNKVKDKLTGKVELQTLIKLIIRGGWPQSLDMTEDEALILTQSYINDVLNFDISNIDGTNREINKMRMIMRSLARNESTIVSNNTIIKDVNEDTDVASRNTVLDYINVLEKLYLIENQEAFSTNLRSSNRIGKSAKRHLVDPSLACGILGLTSEKLLGDVNFLGTNKIEEAAKNLLKFNDMVTKKTKFLCVISGLNEAIIKRPDGVYVLPITALKN